MKWSFLLFSSFLCLQAIAQYPATGNKMRLGWQTTGDGLVYRGAIGDTATLDPSGLNNAWMLLDTANGNLYAYRAKAWRLVSGGGGSVSDTLTGEVKGPLDSTYIDTVANIIFTTTTDTTVGVGELEYNDTQGSLIQGLKGGNVTNVIGQQIHQRVTNATGGPLTKGTAVFLHGSQGNRITVRKALATVDSTSANTFGIVAESIADNQSGYVITEGLITNMNTNALTEGAAVYLSPTIAGELTTTKPQAPQHTVYIGVCVKQNAGSGELFVKIRNGQELDELHDVRIDSLASNASLYYNAAQGVWRDTGAAVLVADTSAMLTNYINVVDTATMLSSYISNADTSAMLNSYAKGSSAADRIAYWNGTRNITGSSLLRHTSNNRMVIGTLNAPTGRVHIRSENNTPNLIIDSYNNETSGSIVFTGGDNAFFSSEESFFINIDADNNQTTRQFGVLKNSYGSIGGQQILSVRELDNSLIIFNGNIAINTTSPQRNLHVTGDARITNLKPAASPRNIVGSSSTGDLTTLAWGNGLTVTLADTILRVDTSVILPKVNVSGTTNYLAKFTAGNRVGNSQVFDDGTNVGISDATPSYKLDVNGTAYATTVITNGNFVGNGQLTTGDGRSGSLLIGPSTTTSPGYFYGSYGAFYGAGHTTKAGSIEFATGQNTNGSIFFITESASTQNNTLTLTKDNYVGINTISPSRHLHVNATSAIRIPVGNFAQRGTSGAGDIRVRNDTANLEFHNGTSWQTVATQSYVTDNAISTVYIPINLYAPGDTVANTTNSKAFFLVHSGLNGYCIDSYTVKAFSGSGTADIQIDKNGTGGNLQAISGTTTATKDTNIALATGDYIRGQVFNLSGTLVGLGLTLEIKKTCN